MDEFGFLANAVVAECVEREAETGRWYEGSMVGEYATRIDDGSYER